MMAVDMRALVALVDMSERVGVARGAASRVSPRASPRVDRPRASTSPTPHAVASVIYGSCIKSGFTPNRIT